MEPFAVVEDFDVFEDGRAGGRDGCQRLAIDEFGFEGGEEALGDSVIPTLPWAAERLAHVVAGEQIAEGREVYWVPRSE